MHELSIAQTLVRTAVEQATRRGAKRIMSLELVLGSLAGVQEDSLTFCFPIAARDTLCAEAELRITRVQAIGHCASCGSATEVSNLMDPCSKCQAWPLKVEGGKEIILRSMEVD